MMNLLEVKIILMELKVSKHTQRKDYLNLTVQTKQYLQFNFKFNQRRPN
jgi:hypothetical protein